MSLLTFFSCGKENQKASTTLLIKGANSATNYSNGIVINAKKENSNEFFSISIASNSGEISKQISKGTWTFAVIGWLPNGTNYKLEGVPKCDSLTKELTLNDEFLEFNLSELNCTQQVFNNNTQNFDSSGLIKKLTLVPCKTLQDSLIQSNGNCDFKKEYIGTSLSYKIVFYTADQSSPPNPTLYSRCLQAADLLSTVITSQIRIPVGGTQNTFSTVIQGYETINCTKPDAKYFFSKGLGNSGTNQTIDSIADYSYTSDDTKFYFADNYVGSGNTPFLNQAIKLECNGTHCYNTPTLRNYVYNSFHAITSYTKTLFGTKDGINEEDLEKKPYINYADASGNGLLIKLAVFDSNHNSYVVNFSTGSPSASYNSSTKVLDIVLSSATDTIDNIYSLLSGVSEFETTKYGITTNSLTIGSEISATSNLLAGQAAKDKKHRNFGVLAEINFFILGPFGGLIAENGYTKCDNSLDSNDVYSAIGASFTKVFNGESVRVDISSGSKNLTSIGGPSSNGLRLTYWHKGKIIGVHEMNCDGIYDKAGWIRISNSDDNTSANNHQIELYYNEGDQTDSQFEMYTKSTDCSSTCLQKNLIRIHKESAQSFKVWVTSAIKNSTGIEHYTRYSGAFDAGLNQLDFKTYSDGVNDNLEPDTLAEYDTEVTPINDCRNVLGAITTCSYNTTNPTTVPILLSDWSTSQTYLNDSSFESNLYSIP
jgi:hypothetical protein